MLGSLRWTDKQREIAQLVADGKEFKDITAFGYSNYMVTKVKTHWRKVKSQKQKQNQNQEPRTRSSRY